MQIRTYRQKELQINMKPKKEDVANVSVGNIVLMAVAKCNFPSLCCRHLTMVDNRKKHINRNY